MSGPLTATQRQAAVLDAAGADRATTAESIGVSEKTISRWRMREDFQRAVREVQGGGRDLRELAETFQAELVIGAAEATRAVREMLDAERAKAEPDPAVITGLAKVLVTKGPSAPPRPTRPMPEVVTVNISPELMAEIGEPPE